MRGGSDGSGFKRKRQEGHSDSDSHKKTPNSRRTAQDLGHNRGSNIRSEYDYCSERSTHGYYQKSKQEVSSKARSNKEKSRGHSRSKKDHHSGRPDLRSKSKSRSQYSDRRGNSISCDERQSESPQAKRCRPDSVEKSPKIITVSDVERSLIHEGRLVGKRLKTLERIDESRLKRMYDLDAQELEAQARRNAKYQPQDWKHDRMQAYQSPPRTILDRYNPRRDMPVEEKARQFKHKAKPVVFHDRYVAKRHSQEEADFE